jgi:hypothetical protein
LVQHYRQLQRQHHLHRTQWDRNLVPPAEGVCHQGLHQKIQYIIQTSCIPLDIKEYSIDLPIVLEENSLITALIVGKEMIYRSFLTLIFS